ncbi:MAG TPA: septum site-determining protein MinC [Stellaceae bacterium]|jgi:septum site-determining protein MinC|nr:septum site-determining protein MinC [Stellaceae bacterium]
MCAELVRTDSFPVITVRVEDHADPNFEGRLAEQIARHPGFFANAPVVMDLENTSGLATADAFHALRRLFKRQHMIAVGIVNGNGTQIRAAMNADLASFRTNGAAEPAPREIPDTPRPVLAPAQDSLPLGDEGRTRIVTLPVRSGTQIYARGGDLIIMNSVSPGAEIIADGHIHVYGALRGRAIAGANGDQSARIFTNRLEAELLCIAGQYLTRDAIESKFVGQFVQVSLDGEDLVIAKI